MADQDDYLALQLYGLECRMARGEHLQQGGERLVCEYRKLKARQGRGLRKPKRDNAEIDRLMAERLPTCACEACGGGLKQARSGSLRARCIECGEGWQFELQAQQGVTAGDTSCRDCGHLFGATLDDPSRDSGCGLCVRCMASLIAELSPSERFRTILDGYDIEAFAEVVAVEATANQRREMVKAYQALSHDQQLRYWLDVQGIEHARQDASELHHLQHVVEGAVDWVASADWLPVDDTYEQLHYMVYSPSYGGDLFKCRYNDLGMWWSEAMQLGISGVTHWRIARDGEAERLATPAELPVTRNA